MTTPSHPSFQQLLEFAFPKELLEAFVVTQFDAEKHVRDDVEIIRITFVEQNAPPPIPEEHRGKRIISKGFNRPVTIQDFPLRGRPCFLTIETRRWEIEGEGTLTRKLSFLPESGLKVTTDFALFLKEADRIRAGGD